MTHVVDLGMGVLGCWCLLSLAGVLVVGAWLKGSSRARVHRARDGSPIRAAGRLLLLPHLIESTAQTQQSARSRRAHYAGDPAVCPLRPAQRCVSRRGDNPLYVEVDGVALECVTYVPLHEGRRFKA